MGSPLSSFLAEAVMQDLEKRSVTDNKDIKTWKRYVDDVLATVKKRLDRRHLTRYKQHDRKHKVHKRRRT